MTISPNSLVRLSYDNTEVTTTAARGGAPCHFINVELAGATLTSITCSPVGRQEVSLTTIYLMAKQLMT